MGIYVSTAIDIEDRSGEIHAGVLLRELVTFGEYLDVALSSSSFESTRGGEAFRWTLGGAIAGLGDLAGGGFGSFGFATSFDGSVVVGTGASAFGSEAFRWISTRS